MSDRDELAAFLTGKVIARAELGPGTIILTFTDGTRFVREKTFEGVIQAALFAPDGGTLAAAVLS